MAKLGRPKGSLCVIAEPEQVHDVWEEDLLQERPEDIIPDKSGRGLHSLPVMRFRGVSPAVALEVMTNMCCSD